MVCLFMHAHYTWRLPVETLTRRSVGLRDPPKDQPGDEVPSDLWFQYGIKQSDFCRYGEAAPSTVAHS